MSAGELFGTTFDCSCGRRHEIEPHVVVCAPDAVGRLGEVCRRLAAGRAGVLMDERTRGVAGQAAADALADAGWDVRAIVVHDLPGGRWPVCDEAAKDALARRMGEVELVAAVGSGVISDLGKWLAWECGAAVVTFATAASMNGYASANVAPTIGGVKTVIRARPPAAVLTSPDILREAPFEMTAAGLGDVLAKSVSSADWRLNQLLFGDYYCQKSVDLVADVEPLYMEDPEGIRDLDAAPVEALFGALLLTGVAMTMAETSAPASGGEHLISHSLDMLAPARGAEHDLHGRQVGVAAVLTAELYRRVLAVESPRLRDAAGGVDDRFWGPLAGAVADQYAQKLPRLADARQKLIRPDAWDNLRRDLAPMLRPPEVLHDCLARATAATSAQQIKTDRDRLADVFGRAHQIRPRFTILDLARIVGVMPEAGAEIIDTWA